MKKVYLDILDKYKSIYPNEEERLEVFTNFLDNHNDEEITDWNNFDGHIVASAFVMAKREHMFAVVYHDGLKMFVYPGGHINNPNELPLSAAKRETTEETGLDNFEVIGITDDLEVPFDINSHIIGYNEKLDLPEHYHFDFRYFFVVDEMKDLVIDESESSDYKWITYDELAKNPHYGECIEKIKNLMNKGV